MKRSQLLSIFAPLLLAACAVSPALPAAGPGAGETFPPADAPQPPAAAQLDPAFILTVTLVPGDTTTSVVDRYGGHLLVWTDTHALLGLSEEEAQGDPGGTLEANVTSFLSGGRAAWMNGSSSLWAGGSSSLWAGGSSSLWAGGSSSLWAGGEFAWMPENTALWDQVRLQRAQELAPNLGLGVKVAVIDTGVDLAHPALQEALAPAEEWWDFVDNDALPQEEGTLGEGGYGHGTNVAGIIRQIAPRATILPIRVLGPDGQGNLSDLVSAIDWAVHKGADVINLSLGSDERFQAVERSLKRAERRGVLVTTSAGNTGDLNVSFPASRADQDGYGDILLSVTSVDGNDAKSTFAAYGSAVEIAAPGENVYGPAPDGRLAAWSGTSMAAPMAAGALALALGETTPQPLALPDALLNATADHYTNPLNTDYDEQLGEGRLNIAAFVRGSRDLGDD